jgi:hypothetical protein
MQHTHLLRIAMILSLFLTYATQVDADESIQSFDQLPKEIRDYFMTRMPVPLGNILQPKFGLQREDWNSERGNTYYQRVLHLPFKTTDKQQHFVYEFESNNNPVDITFRTDSSSAKTVLLSKSFVGPAKGKVIACLLKGETTTLEPIRGVIGNTTRAYYLAVWTEDRTPDTEMTVEMVVSAKKATFEKKEIPQLRIGEKRTVELKKGDIHKLFRLTFLQKGAFEIAFPQIPPDELPFRVELDSQDRLTYNRGFRMVIQKPGVYVLKIDAIDPIDPSKPTTVKPFQIETTFEGQAWQVRAVERLAGPPY